MAGTRSDPAPPRTLVKWGVVVVAVAGFAGISIYLGPNEEDQPSLPSELAEEPDAFVEQGTITQYRDDGALNYRLRAESISYFDDVGRSTLQEPVLELQGANRRPWRVESQAGEVRAVPGTEEEWVELRGDVSLTQVRGGGAYTKILTELLTLYPERRQARAEQTAIIETNTVSARVAGFEADLASGRLALFSSADQRVSIIAQPDHQTAARR
ncbi:MAG: LPS export ABC transporter periplasmic protein LptC [Gammaproteobacteria bacterium]|nr:LPS export ABC transporter periplasmic protein LptC [Gammaproteobacteria bacterium]